MCIRDSYNASANGSKNEDSQLNTLYVKQCPPQQQSGALLYVGNTRKTLVTLGFPSLVN